MIVRTLLLKMMRSYIAVSYSRLRSTRYPSKVIIFFSRTPFKPELVYFEIHEIIERRKKGGREGGKNKEKNELIDTRTRKDIKGHSFFERAV